MDYEMFTPEGNEEVAKIVEVAREYSLTWPEVLFLLDRLSQLELAGDFTKFGEATDTAVREAVYEALGFETPFYTEMA
jgi:hypothetical protein